MPSTSQAAVSIPDLRAAIDGRVITPDDDEYDQARTVVAGGIDRRPLVIVRPANANDVAHARSRRTRPASPRPWP